MILRSFAMRTLRPFGGLALLPRRWLQTNG